MKNKKTTNVLLKLRLKLNTKITPECDDNLILCCFDQSLEIVMNYNEEPDLLQVYDTKNIKQVSQLKLDIKSL